MKTASTYKLLVMMRAIEQGMKPRIKLAGDPMEYVVDSFVNSSHSLALSLSRGGGVMVIALDDIHSVWVPSMPSFARVEAT